MIVQKNEANGFSTGTQPADISITKNPGSKHNMDVLSQGTRLLNLILKITKLLIRHMLNLCHKSLFSKK